MSVEGGGNNLPRDNDKVIEFPEGGRQGIVDRLTEERNNLRRKLTNLRVHSSRDNITQQKKLEQEIRDLDLAIVDNLQAMGRMGKPKNPEDNGDNDPDPPKRAI